jgi:hypothetical protein
MTRTLVLIDSVLARIERLAQQLQSDPDEHVRRSANELRSAFDSRAAIEPAVARVRDSMQMLRLGDREGLRRVSQRRAHGIDHLEEVVEQELLPHLRRIGFEV